MNEINWSGVYTIKDIADYLKVHKHTVVKLIRTKKLRHIRIGVRSIRITGSNLLEYINNNEAIHTT